MLKQSPELTYKGNASAGRHNWLRLTPAYSVALVSQILQENPQTRRILDPFSGTGTTGLLAIQKGLSAALLDINPFLLWLAKIKTNSYTSEAISQTKHLSKQIISQSTKIEDNSNLWIPEISNIDRWWSSSRVQVLAKIFHEINLTISESSPVKDLLLLNFCKLIITWSNASFNHQSMSFSEQEKITEDESIKIYNSFSLSLDKLLLDAKETISPNISICEADSRTLDIDIEPFDCVISSPPYSNRMSYIRELRPYMYWLGYLQKAREAGELDWKAIGGTWGIATSRLKDWQSQEVFSSTKLDRIVTEIAHESEILANYVHKYMEDMFFHFYNLRKLLHPNAKIFYIVGNSKFYETLVPVQDFYAEILRLLKFKQVEVRALRKRNSKKELYEFVVSAKY